MKTIYEYNQETKTIVLGDRKKLYINKVDDFDSFPLYEKALCKNYQGCLNPPDFGAGYLTLVNDPDWVTFVFYKENLDLNLKENLDLNLVASREAYAIKFEYNDRTGFLITIKRSGIIFFDWQDFRKPIEHNERFGSIVIFYENDEIKEIVEYRKTSNEIANKYWRGSLRVYKTIWNHFL